MQLTRPPTVGYDPLAGKTAQAVDVTFRAKKTQSAVCTPSVMLGETSTGLTMTAAGVALATDTYVTQTLHFALAMPVVSPVFTTQLLFDNGVSTSRVPPHGDLDRRDGVVTAI